MTSISPLLLLVIGAPVNCLAGLISFLRRSVDAGGAASGAALGTAVFIAAGPLLWVILAAFVASSSAFTRFRAEEKDWLTSIQQKGGRRDALQVVANGGVSLLMALLLRFTREPSYAVGFAAALASANADTWASEIGVLSRRSPVSLLTLRTVPRGVSGGVTMLGLAAAAGGALFIALLFAAESMLLPRNLAGVGALFGLVTATGLFGSFVDSFLGSTIQGQYTGKDSALTERGMTDGRSNTLVRGLAFVTNDVVNLGSTAAAAFAGILLSGLLR